MAEEKQLMLAAARGGCGGVRAALAALERALAEHPGAPVCVLCELVHNRHVTADFSARGVRFIADLSELPPGAVLILGAHGVPPETERRARELAHSVIDTTCPRVRACQREAAKLGPGDTLIVLGQADHTEVAGIVGHSGAGRNVVISSAREAETQELTASAPVVVAQTSFDVVELERCREILSRRFPELVFRGGVCRASRERQECAEKLARKVEALVVVGSAHSSNARRLCGHAERVGIRGVLAECAADLPPELFALRRVGLTAGASTPDADVEEILTAFAAAGFAIAEDRCDGDGGEKDD